MRDKIGSFMSRARSTSFLNRWISNYVLPTTTRPRSIKAQHPLREARVDVVEVPGKPGATARSRSCGRTSSSTSSVSHAAGGRAAAAGRLNVTGAPGTPGARRRITAPLPYCSA